MGPVGGPVRARRVGPRRGRFPAGGAAGTARAARGAPAAAPGPRVDLARSAAGPAVRPVRGCAVRDALRRGLLRAADHRADLRGVRPRRVLGAAHGDRADPRGHRARLPLGTAAGSPPAGLETWPPRRAGVPHAGDRRFRAEPDVALPAGVRLHRAAVAGADVRAVAGRRFPCGDSRGTPAAARQPGAGDGGGGSARAGGTGRARPGAVRRGAERRALRGDREDRHLSTLSADAVPALVRLPEAERWCALAGMRATPDDDWRSWNAAQLS